MLLEEGKTKWVAADTIPGLFEETDVPVVELSSTRSSPSGASRQALPDVIGTPPPIPRSLADWAFLEQHGMFQERSRISILIYTVVGLIALGVLIFLAWTILGQHANAAELTMSPKTVFRGPSA
jgi:hypothetical protein